MPGDLTEVRFCRVGARHVGNAFEPQSQGLPVDADEDLQCHQWMANQHPRQLFRRHGSAPHEEGGLEWLVFGRAVLDVDP